MTPPAGAELEENGVTIGGMMIDESSRVMFWSLMLAAVVVWAIAIAELAA